MTTESDHLSPRPINLFYAYAPNDEHLRRELDTHLSLLKRDGLISVWHDRKIDAGIEWASEIDAYLNTADIVLLLISADFMASEYCFSTEMKRALQRHDTGDARVIPVILRSVDWEDAPFSKLQVLPKYGKPVESSSWHNRDEAFKEVTQGIRAAVQELIAARSWSGSILKDRSHLFPVQPFVWNVPYRRNPFFTGRDDILVQLHTRLNAVKELPLVQPQAITGLGGIGKTQTVLEYAYRFRNNYRYVFWTRAATLDVLNADFVTLARLLQLREKDERDQQLVVEAVKRWLSNSNDWLLIFDNADDLQLIYDFLPLGNRGHLLLTTRTLAVGILATTIELEKMNQEESVLLLLRRGRIITPEASLDQVAEADRSSAAAIATALDGLPLALDQVGAYIEETGCSLSEYLTLYQTRRKDLLKRQSGLPTDYPETVATTWSISFQKIKQSTGSPVRSRAPCR